MHSAHRAEHVHRDGRRLAQANGRTIAQRSREISPIDSVNGAWTVKALLGRSPNAQAIAARKSLSRRKRRRARPGVEGAGGIGEGAGGCRGIESDHREGRGR